MKKTYEFENLGCAHCAGKMEEKNSGNFLMLKV